MSSDCERFTIYFFMLLQMITKSKYADMPDRVTFNDDYIMQNQHYLHIIYLTFTTPRMQELSIRYVHNVHVLKITTASVS